MMTTKKQVSNLKRRARQRGHELERLVANILKKWWPDAKRGLQSRGAAKDKVADVINVPFWVECKHWTTPYMKQRPVDLAAKTAAQYGRSLIVVKHRWRGETDYHIFWSRDGKDVMLYKGFDGCHSDKNLPDFLDGLIEVIIEDIGKIETEKESGMNYLPTEEKPMWTVAKCPIENCGALIMSTHRHDYAPCPCGAIAVDGGSDYFKMTFDSSRVNLDDIECASFETIDETRLFFALYDSFNEELAFSVENADIWCVKEKHTAR